MKTHRTLAAFALLLATSCSSKSELGRYLVDQKYKKMRELA